MSVVPAPPAAVAQPTRDNRLAGSLFSPWRLEENLITVLQLGLPRYLDEAAYQDGGEHNLPRPRVERPRSWERHDDIDGLPDDQLPRIIVINQGTIRRPDRDGQGVYSAPWLVTVAAVAYDPVHQVAKRTIGAYFASIVGLMTQQAPLSDPLIRDITWTGAATPSLGASGMDRQQRLLAAVRLDFEITIDRVTSDHDGPLGLDTPPVTPGPIDMGDQPIVTDTDFTVTPTTEEVG